MDHKASSTYITLYCVVEGANIFDSSFPVNIKSNALIDELKRAIMKCQGPAFTEIASKDLQIFKDCLPIKDVTATLSDQAQRLPSIGRVSEYWDVRSSETVRVVRVVVRKLPATDGQIGDPEFSALRKAKRPNVVQSVFTSSKARHNGPIKMDVLTEADKADARLSLFTSGEATKPLELTKEQAEFHMMVASLPAAHN